MKVDLTPYRRYIREELTPDKKERGKYACPICGSGTRPGGDGAFSIDKDEIHGTCFSCGFRGDIFDLYAARDGITLVDATRAVIAKYGKPDAAPAAYTKAVEVSKPTPQPAVQASRRRAAEYVLACHKAMQGSPAADYLQRRGISQESINRYRLGYDAQTNHLVIPHDPAGSYYITRDLSGEQGVPKYLNPKGLEAVLFNAAALYTDEPCFVVESDLCAISIEQEGGKAVALAGTGGQSRLLAQIRQQKPTAPALIVSLDNDAAGHEAALKLIAELEKQGIRPDVVVVDPPRKGLNADTIEALSRMAPRRIVYVSCDPATLARDVALLKQRGYALQSATAADLFPRCAHVETVVLLSKGEIDSKNIRVEFSLEDMDMSEFQDGATYPQIKAYVLEHAGLKVSSLYISQVKRKCGLEVGKNYNLPKSEDARQAPTCPPEKENAIREALQYFGMI